MDGSASSAAAFPFFPAEFLALALALALDSALAAVSATASALALALALALASFFCRALNPSRTASFGSMGGSVSSTDSASSSSSEEPFSFPASPFGFQTFTSFFFHVPAASRTVFSRPMGVLAGVLAGVSAASTAAAFSSLLGEFSASTSSSSLDVSRSGRTSFPFLAKGDFRPPISLLITPIFASQTRIFQEKTHFRATTSDRNVRAG